MDHSTTGETIFKLILALGFLLAIGGNILFRGQPPSGPTYYYPDPTPYVVETQRIELFSGNKLCIGANVSC